jgi:hypothetical protein
VHSNRCGYAHPEGLAEHFPAETRITGVLIFKLLKNIDKYSCLFSVQSKKNPDGKAI